MDDTIYMKESSYIEEDFSQIKEFLNIEVTKPMS